MSRAPGFFEKHFFLRNSLGFYTNLSTTAKYNRHVDRTHLAAALQLMISENPWFCTNFFKVNNTGDVYKDYELRPVDEIKFDSVVGFSKLKSLMLTPSSILIVFEYRLERKMLRCGV